MTRFTYLSTGAAAFIAAALIAGAAVAQTQFRDERTGKVWTLDNVSQDSRPGAPTSPVSPQDRVFNPNAQTAVVEGVTVQRPRTNLMGVVPV